MPAALSQHMNHSSTHPYENLPLTNTTLWKKMNILLWRRPPDGHSSRPMSNADSFRTISTQEPLLHLTSQSSPPPLWAFLWLLSGVSFERSLCFLSLYLYFITVKSGMQTKRPPTTLFHHLECSSVPLETNSTRRPTARLNCVRMEGVTIDHLLLLPLLNIAAVSENTNEEEGKNMIPWPRKFDWTTQHIHLVLSRREITPTYERISPMNLDYHQQR